MTVNLCLGLGPSIADYPEVMNKHALAIMSDLGIVYEECEPHMYADCWYFYGCINVPDPLPGYLTRTERKPPLSSGKQT